VTAKQREVVRFDLQDRLVRKLDGVPAQIGLFRIPDVEPYEVQQGTYELHVDTIVFEEGSDIDAQFISFGQVHGAAARITAGEIYPWPCYGVHRLRFPLVFWPPLGPPSPPCS
jgi:hypothetical protein